MGARATALGLAAVSLMTPMMASAAPPMDVAQARAAFTVELPDGCAVEDGALRAGSAIFHVTCDGRVYVGVYAGNAADRDMPRSRLMVTETRWPSEVQVWSAVVPDDQARADAIAASVKPRRVKIAWG